MARQPVARQTPGCLPLGRVAVAVAVVVVLCTQGCVSLLGGGALRPGTTAPALAVQFLGEPLTLEQLSWQTVLINFWGSA